MTTIAFDGMTLAADRRMGGGYNVPKVFKLRDGRYAAGCGDYDYVLEIIHWLNRGSPRDDVPVLPDKNEDGEPAAEVIVVSAKGVVSWLTWPFLREQKLTETKVAFGSGSDYALGAMAAGATARQALKIAHRYDPDTGMGFDCVRVVKGEKAP
jgi:hypothetical protein